MVDRELWEGWIPSNPKEKIDVGVKIIRAASTEVQRQFDQTLRTHQQALNDQNSEIERITQANAELTAGLEGLRKSIKEMQDKNEKLKQTVTNLTKQNSKYANMKSAVLSSFCSDIPEPEPWDSFLPAARTTEDYGDLRHPFERTQQLEQVLQFSPSRAMNFDLTPPASRASFSQKPPKAYSPMQGSSFTSHSPLAYTATIDLPRPEPSGKSYVDGKKLFREMRQAVPPQVFSQFLASVKKLNDRHVAKESVLEEIGELLGVEFHRFYENFANLISNPL